GEDLEVAVQAEARDDRADVHPGRRDPRPVAERAETGPDEARAQIVPDALPGLRHGERQNRPGAVPVVVDDALPPDAVFAVAQDLLRPGSEPEVHAAPRAVPCQQAPRDHAAERRPDGVLADAEAREGGDEASGEHRDVAPEDVVAEVAQ